MRKAIFIGVQILCGLTIYGLFSFALFLGLQVNPLAGTLSTVAVLALIAIYAYWLVRSHQNKKR